MGHLLFAYCMAESPAVRALDAALETASADHEEPRLTRLSRLDLDRGPRIGRVRAAIGLGWQARDRLARVARDAGAGLDAVLEVCVCGHHHLLGLGRTGVATVRWTPRGPASRTWLDRLASAEGTEVVLEGKTPSPKEAQHLVQRILAMLEAERRPRSPVPGPARGKA